MSQVEVRVFSGAREWELGSVPKTIPATQVVLAIRGSARKTATLDGRPVRFAGGAVGVLAVDLTRSTGFHRLDVGADTFWFATEDAKLRLAGIESMLAEMATLGTGWGGQALFSDGTGLRDPHVVYGWLDQWADRSLTAVESVLAGPKSRTIQNRKLSRRGGAGVPTPPTLRLLRSSPTQYLSERDDGLIAVGDRAYDPLRVVVRHRTTTVQTVANVRAVSVLGWITRLTTEVVDSHPSSAVVTRCRLWANRAATLAGRPLARKLLAAASPSGIARHPRQAEELAHPPYRDTYDAFTDIGRLFGWSAAIRPLTRYSYVEQSDRIYQAYTATRLAKSLGLQQTDAVLGSSPLAFTSAVYDLYYDTTSPPHVLRSWRADSLRPDDSRPDLLLHERATGRVAVLDAKYRQAKDGGASEDSRKEVTAYLGLYGLPAVSILYPGKADTLAVSGHGRTIHEVAVRPGDTTLDSAIEVILASMATPAF